MRYCIVVLIAIAVWNLPSFAKTPDDAIRLRIGEIPAVKVHAGDSVMVKIPITVARGFHVNANPAASDDYIPLEVKFDTTSGIQPGLVLYPKGKTWRLEGSSENLLVYGGAFEVKFPLIVDRKAKPGQRVLQGTVEFQACDNQVCFLPESLPVKVTMHVIGAK